jgi:drug/metabolite transporter (DMT)-like permease
MLVLSLALGASLCYGVSNFLGPQLVRRHALVTVLVISQAAALAVCVLYLAVAGGRALPSPDMWLALLAGAGNAGGLIGFYKAAELGPLSVVAPIGASGAVIPVVWGLASGDSLRAPQAAGLVLAMGGAVLVARRGAGHHSTAHYSDRSGGTLASDRLGRHSLRSHPRIDQHPPFGQHAAVLWAGGSAVAFGVFLTALPKASVHGRAWALLDARLALVALLAMWAGRELATIRLVRESALLVVPGVLLVIGTVMYTTAAAHGQLSLVSVLGSLFPVVTVGLGVALLGERMSRTQAVGVAAALTGIALIAL